MRRVIAVVDVDVETGMIKIVRYCTVHDCGNMINPQIVDTQQQGSIMQGIGAALYEELRYSEDGQLLSSTFMDYRLPSAEEVPELALEHIVTPNPFTPLGAKGAGETGMLGPPPALCSAVEDALSPFGVKSSRDAAHAGQSFGSYRESAGEIGSMLKTISLTRQWQIVFGRS